jgi:hypothetical protein
MSSFRVVLFDTRPASLFKFRYCLQYLFAGGFCKRMSGDLRGDRIWWRPRPNPRSIWESGRFIYCRSSVNLEGARNDWNSLGKNTRQGTTRLEGSPAVGDKAAFSVPIHERAGRARRRASSSESRRRCAVLNRPSSGEKSCWVCATSDIRRCRSLMIRANNARSKGADYRYSRPARTLWWNECQYFCRDSFRPHRDVCCAR